MDGEETRYLLSAYQAPRLIAEHASYQLAAEDIADWAPIQDGTTQQETSISRRIIIDRADIYTINLYGNPFEKRTHLADPNEILAEAGVVMQREILLLLKVQ